MILEPRLQDLILWVAVQDLVGHHLQELLEIDLQVVNDLKSSDRST